MDAKQSDVVEAQIEAVKNADTLGETAFSRLFHEARTTGRNRATGVTVQVRVRDGEFEVHETPIKTRRGEHLCGTDAWDGKVSLPVKPFMGTQTARQEIARQLHDLLQTYSIREQRDAEREKIESGEWSQ